MKELVKSILPLRFRIWLRHLQAEIMHHSGYLTRREANFPHATHIPVLIGLESLKSFEQVLELGSGSFSTLMFANRAIFPKLKRIDSLENDPDWLNKVSESVGHDERVNLVAVNGQIFTALQNYDLSEYDLIFLDDSSTENLRARTIQEVSARHGEAKIVVIHDFENKIYRQASKLFTNRFRFTAMNPNVGVLWDNNQLDRAQLKQINNLIKKNYPAVSPQDVSRWKQILHISGSDRL